jgi:hypothetical protein
MAAHRYWRLYVTAAGSGGYCSLAELEMYESIEPLNVCSGGTASASSDGFGWVPANAFNGTHTGNGWHSGANTLPATPEWLKYDFGSGNDKDIQAIKMVGRGDSNAVNQTPKDFQLQYSDDDSSWSTLFTITGAANWGAYYGTQFFKSGGRYLPPPVGAGTSSKRAWRVNATVVDGSDVMSVSEITMRTSPSGSDVASGGTPFITNPSEGVVANAFDDPSSDALSYVATGTALAGVGEHIGYLFASAKNIVEIAIRSRSSNGAQAPKDFTIDYWDVNQWTTAHTVTGETGWGSAETRTFTFPGAGLVFRWGGLPSVLG